MIKPLRKNVLVKLLPLYSSGEDAFGPILIDQKKHWDHKIRRARVLATGPAVREISSNDVVVFPGTAGRWVDPPAVSCEQDHSDFRCVEEEECLALEVASYG